MEGKKDTLKQSSRERMKKKERWQYPGKENMKCWEEAKTLNLKDRPVDSVA